MIRSISELTSVINSYRVKGWFLELLEDTNKHCLIICAWSVEENWAERRDVAESLYEEVRYLLRR